MNGDKAWPASKSAILSSDKESWFDWVKLDAVIEV